MKDIKGIIIKSVYGTLSAGEQMQLDAWLADADNRKRYSRIRQRLLQRDAITFLAEVDTEKAYKQIHQRLHRHTLRIAVATISIAAALLGAVWLWQMPQESRQEATFIAEVPITKQQATLELATGEVLALDATAQTHQSEQEVIEIANKEIQIKKGAQTVGHHTLNVPHGDNYSITLTDGTRVWVNALSQLKFPSSFEGLNERVVELTGEAYFEVAPDKAHPFKVRTAQQLITVTGTAFNISAYADDATRTTLCEGSVEVKTPAEENIQLIPGQQLTITPNGEHTIAEVNTQLFTAWIHGIYYFDNQTLDEVFGVLKRWYDIREVTYDSAANRHQLFSGKLRKTDTIETIIKVIERGSNRSIHYENGTMEIK